MCNKIEIDQLQCVICWVLGNYDRNFKRRFRKAELEGKKHKESNFSNYIDWPPERSKPMKIRLFT